MRPLRSNEGIEGKFFLGSGTIQTQTYYFFYKRHGDGFQLDKLIANGALQFTKKNAKMEY